MLHRNCEGIRRRDALTIGGLTFGGLALSDYRQLSAAGNVVPSGADRAIFINLDGGPSHIDSFDPKPDAEDGVRGPFQTIATKTPGMRLSEHLPKLAGISDHFTLLRGVSHTLAAHRLGQEYVATGTKPIASLTYPSIGSVHKHETTGRDDLPGYVAIPNSPFDAGFLGVEYAPLETTTQPQPGRPYSVRGISLPAGVNTGDLKTRRHLLSQLDRRFDDLAEHDPLIRGLDRFAENAGDMILSPAARSAFDISKEPESFSKSFGEKSFGQSCLLALRLIESGVGFVNVRLGGWDTHNSAFDKLSNNLLPTLDEGLSALLVGLKSRGLLDRTAVMVSGEFGRTPKINSRAPAVGRDHYPRCMFMLMAGGRVSGGRVIGESDATGSGPKNDAITPSDVAASFYANLGIDPTMELHTGTGRPITLVRDGNVIDGILS